MRIFAATAFTIGAMALGTPAHAASDYLLEFGGVDGEASQPATVNSWSFGVCNAGQCSSQATKRTVSSDQPVRKGSVLQASQNSQSLREAPSHGPSGQGKISANVGEATAGPAIAVGDVNGDGRADLAYAATQPEVASLTLTFGAASPELARVCTGKHIAKATLRGAGESFELSDAAITCSASPDTGQTGGRNSMPARISTNMTVAKQTGAETFADRCGASACTVTVVFTGGQMKHTKTGHVTILK